MRLPQYIPYWNIQDLLNAEAPEPYTRLVKAMGSEHFEDLITAFFTSNYEFTDTSHARGFQTGYMKWVREKGYVEDLQAVVSVILDFSDNTKRFYGIDHSGSYGRTEMYGYGSNHPYYDGYIDQFLTFIDNIADEPELRTLIKPQHLLDGFRDVVSREYTDRFYVICSNNLLDKLSQAPCIETGTYKELPKEQRDAYLDAMCLGVSRGVIDSMVNPRPYGFGKRRPNYERHAKVLNDLTSALGLSNEYPDLTSNQQLIEGSSSADFPEDALCDTANPYFQKQHELSPYQKLILMAIRRGTSQGIGTLTYNGQTRLVPDFIWNAQEMAYDTPLGRAIEEDIKRGIQEAVDLAYTNQESGYTLPKTYRNDLNIDLFQEPASGDLTVERLFGLQNFLKRLPEYEKLLQDAVLQRTKEGEAPIAKSVIS